MLSNNEEPQVVCSTARWLILSAISMFDLDYTSVMRWSLLKQVQNYGAQMKPLLREPSLFWDTCFAHFSSMACTTFRI